MAGLSGLLPSLACFFELAIALAEDHLLQSVQLIGRGDVAQGAVEPAVVVQPHNQTPMIPRLRFSIRGIPGLVSKSLSIKSWIGEIKRFFAAAE